MAQHYFLFNEDNSYSFHSENEISSEMVDENRGQFVKIIDVNLDDFSDITLTKWDEDANDIADDSEGIFRIFTPEGKTAWLQYLADELTYVSANTHPEIYYELYQATKLVLRSEEEMQSIFSDKYVSPEELKRIIDATQE